MKIIFWIIFIKIIWMNHSGWNQYQFCNYLTKPGAWIGYRIASNFDLFSKVVPNIKDEPNWKTRWLAFQWGVLLLYPHPSWWQAPALYEISELVNTSA